MKKTIVLIASAALAAAASIDLSDAYKKIPDIAKDQSKVMDVLWELAPSNRPFFVEQVEKAFRSYPASDEERTNMLVRLAYYCRAFTNSTPTTVLAADWHTQLRHQQLMKLEGVKVRSGSMFEDGVPLDEAVVTVPLEFSVPRAYIDRRAAHDSAKPYNGQSF